MSSNPAPARLVSLTIALPYHELAGQMALHAGRGMALPLTSPPPLPPPAPSPFSHQIASRLYALRRRRDAMLPADLFGEPAWDMLLDLFVQQSQGRTVSVTSLCIASATPQTTALRYITLMEAAGLITRAHCASDQRVVWLTMVPRVLARLGAYLKDSFARMIAAEAG
jgi:DNA-binding MarR family transcriptional regulator